MTVPPSQAGAPNAKFKQSIAIGEISGGRPEPWWSNRSDVENRNLKAALEESLAGIGYLAPSGIAPQYTLDAKLLSLDQPVVGFAVTVTSKVDYRLSGHGAIHHLPITATGTATFSDSASYVKRQRLAIENSIRENIRELLQQLQSQ